MTAIHIPEAFAASTSAREGSAGREWIRTLPKVIGDLFQAWNLTPDGQVMHGYVGVVIPVLQRGIERVLKISWVDESSSQEGRALRLWGGRGAVLLFEEDPDRGAMLLERLDSSRTLSTAPIRQAVEIAGHLLRELAIPAPGDIRTVASEVSRMQSSLPAAWERTGRPFSRRLLEDVLELARELSSSDPGLMVNTDLHFENVLAGTREPWLTIDPKVLAGALEFGVAQLLWNRFEELHTSRDLEDRLLLTSEAAALDPARARGWTIIRVSDYWVWALDEGFTQDPKRCRQLTEWLHPRGKS